MRRAILRAPGPQLVAGERSFVNRHPIDSERAAKQHSAYGQTLAELGCELIELPVLPEFGDACFVEDMAIVLPDVAVLSRPGADSRRGELCSVADALEPFRELISIEVPGHLDGGDVFVVDNTIFVGQSRRTNHAGLKQLAHLLLGYGYRIKAVEVLECLHLKTACTWLGGEHMLMNANWIRSDRIEEFRRIDVDPAEPFGGTALVVGETVLMSATFPRTADRVRAAGYDVRTLDISEFEKAEGGLTCLSLIFED